MVGLLSSNQIFINKIMKQNDIKRRCDFKNICLYETSKVAVSARVISSDIRWRRILHE